MAVLAALAAAHQTLAADVTRPATVENVVATRSGSDVVVSWQPVTSDAAGQPETTSHYKVYRGTSPAFVPDRLGGTNLAGTSPLASFNDTNAAASGSDFYYLVSAVDAAGNESNIEPSTVLVPPVLSGFWTEITIETDWTPAAPAEEIAGYRIYWGQHAGEYEGAADVGLATSHSFDNLTPYTAWYIAVTALDAQGNESAFSNEHVDAIRGIVRLRAHDQEELCWGGDCVPSPGTIQRNGGFQALVAVDFPPGDWVRATATLTMESRLCIPPHFGTTSKCGAGNPCVSPPCNGGYNPCGDPWDRLAHMFLVLDDCIETGGNCITNDNLELIRAVTPFGTDHVPPQGAGAIPPRALSMDVTPYVPLLAGTRWIGVDIVHFVQKGWWVTVDFELSKRPEQASPEPPADGIQVVGFGGAPLPLREVSVPPEATSVKLRLFTTGHGGDPYCNGGSNNGLPCTNGCPGGACAACDEFCQRRNRILRDGTPIWQFTPWRTDCSPGPQCNTWNACGFPSCTFPRAGWCPGYIACHHNAPCDQDLEMTPSLIPGGSYQLGFDVVPQNGSWPVSLVLYWYE
jgi:hypothetical protein